MIVMMMDKKSMIHLLKIKMKTKINSKVLRLHKKLIQLKIKMNRLNSNKLSLLFKLKIIKFMTIKRKMNRKINNMNQLITNIIL
jgi:hypothetical protein